MLSAAASSAAPIGCHSALGVMTVPGNLNRRTAARATWMGGANVGRSLLVRFLLRAQGLGPRVLQELHQEQARHGDVTMLQVAGGGKGDDREYVMRGRILALLAWLRVAPTLCPGADWIGKADDDAYIVTVDWERQLRLIRAGVEQPSVLYGYTTWHNYDVKDYVAKSFSFGYAPGLHWKRAIRYLEGDTSVARSLGEAKELSACGRVPSRCQHCTSYDNCVGPFPFATGWAFALSSRLARALVESAAVEADVRRTSQLPASRTGAPIFEDIWLGSALHRFLPAEPTAFVNGFNFYFFNGRWDVGRGRDANTTLVYHNRRSADVHEHVRLVHVPPRPRLECTLASDNVSPPAAAAPASAAAALAAAKRPQRRRLVHRYTRGILTSYRNYFVDTGRLNSSACALIEPSKMGDDPQVEWKPLAAPTTTSRAGARPTRRGGPAGRRRARGKLR